MKKKKQMIIVSALFTDGAVLCREKEIRVFGRAEAGAEVTVTLLDAGKRTLATGHAREKDGRFLALLPPQKAQNGCSLTFECGEEQYTSEGIAIGDVYLAGGQSNMEWPLEGAEEGREVIAAHEDADLRFFNIPRMAYVCPQQREAADTARWEAIQPGKGGGNSAVASFFGACLRKAHPEVPVGIIDCYWGGTSVSCWMPEEALRESTEGIRYLDEYAQREKGITMKAYQAAERKFQKAFGEWNEETIRYREAHPEAKWPEIEAACGKSPWNPPAGPGSPYRPTGLFESMLMEAVPVTLTGALYYQGEEDTYRTEHYDILMTQLIRSWRRLFRDPELPFLFVQLPMWTEDGAEDQCQWARLRLAQAAARDAVRNSGMICLLDEGEYGNLHPTRKRVVGERLAELAKKIVYGEDGETSPRAVGKSVSGNVVTVRLNAEVTTEDGKAPGMMEIAGEDGVFHPAYAVSSGCELRVWNKEVSWPEHVRYGWCDYSDEVKLRGKNGLPAEPFWL